MSEHRRPPVYRAFILRVWPGSPEQQGSDAWRVQLVNVSSGESRSFRDPIKLAAFLYSAELMPDQDEDEPTQ